ncbi:N-acetylneuraminate synthase family protein [Candidatus Pelagibacter sp. HIMB1485]|uniref:N-acetylneuraminate synthase family protein n=1 Tax=Candidatus Pelagibacter sp. HIMB1485 TaxID=3415415 RepID=UPI003F871553
MSQTEYIQIGKRKIGPNYKPFVIFELGINHNGSLKLAKKIVDEAIKCGAEVIKHQTHIAEDEMSEEAKKIIPVHTKKNIFDIINNCALNEKDELELKNYIEKKKCIFLSTPFSREAVKRLVKFKVKAFKIGSGECNNYPLIDYIASFKKPIIISTGMNDIKSIKKSIKIIKKYKTKYAILHTTNLYPTPHRLVRLNALKQIKKFFPKTVYGLSDHTGDNYTSFAAVSLGASIIEKHFIDKSTRSGPDITASVNSLQMRDLMKGVNLIHQAIPGEIKPVHEEKKTAEFAFASVVSNNNIKAGEILTKKNIWVRRPGTGDFSAEKFQSLIGKRIKKDIKKNTQIKKTHF